MYEKLYLYGRLFLIDVESPESFSLKALCRFLEGNSTDETNKIVKGWPPKNTLSYQLKKEHGPTILNRMKDFYSLKFKGTVKNEILGQSMVSDLRKPHFWINDADRRYNYLVAASSQY